MSGKIDPSRILWKATALEQMFALSHLNGTDITCYNLTIALKIPLKKEHMEEAVRHLYRKCPNLRVCQEYDEFGQLWTCKMKKEEILFEFLDCGEDYEERFLNETRKQHQVETGPMWRITVMPTNGVFDEELAGYGFKYQYQILFGLHHSITDGHSSMRMCGFLTSLLDDVIEGRKIDDEQQLADFLDDRYNNKIFEEVKEKMRKDPAKYEDIKAQLKEDAIHYPLHFLRYDLSNEDKTDTVAATIPEPVISKFYANAKAAGITVHSAFCAVVHAAIVDMLIEKKVECDLEDNSFRIRCAHDINSRRYFDCDTEYLFGVHVGLHRITISTPRNIKENLWVFGQKFHKQLAKELDDKESYMYALADSESNPPAKTLEEFRALGGRSPFYYGTSNMGNITRFFRKNNGSQFDSVRVAHIRRSTSMPPSIYSSTFCIQTLNGKLIISYDFVTRYLNKDLAGKLLSSVVKIIENEGAVAMKS